MEVATGQVAAVYKPRHRRQEFPALLKQVARDCPEGQLHLIMDNPAMHKSPSAKRKPDNIVANAAPNFSRAWLTNVS
ncbi:hypothetical protein [Kocuria sp. WN036]|uniref:hypothetical protein n=1 Tax=Kocuria sp. WN036 TaxID=2032628 RepID=UPI0034E981D1